MKLCLNGIVKNEADKIERMLKSVAPYISHYVIADTGSTDDTIAIIERVMGENGIPGQIERIEFKNFSQARNEALDLARNSPFDFDMILLVDADMELVVTDPNWLDGLEGNAYDLLQRSSALAYSNRRLVTKNSTGTYRGATHEYLDIRADGLIQGAHFVDHADGSNRKDKFVRDIALLLEDLKVEPANARSWFYLAQSYRDAGDFERSALAYQRRIELGGWPEEVHNAQMNLAVCYKNLGKDGEFIRNALLAYNMRPTRAEPLYDVANHLRQTGVPVSAAMFAEAGLSIPYPTDSLFVSNYVYQCGLAEEFSIAGFYDPKKRDRAFSLCNSLALSKDAPQHTRDLARTNLFHYLQPLKAVASSFKSIAYPSPDPEWPALNPSIARHNNQLWMIQRTVNYNITPQGTYAIRGTDGSINRENPIRTRNYLHRLDRDGAIEVTKEILPPADMPVEYDLVIGFEDMRLFSWKGALWATASVRQLAADGVPEQVLVRLSEEGDHIRLGHIYRLTRETRVCEKNWMPWMQNGMLRFAYKCDEIIDVEGDVRGPLKPPQWDVGHLRGSSQVVMFDKGWLAVVHEAGVRPDNRQRYYQHRFVYFKDTGDVVAISRPFVFEDKQIEFCAGLCWHPDGKQLLISYGVRDCEAKLAFLQHEQVLGAFR